MFRILNFDITDGKAESREERRKKRKSRWGGTETEKVVIPGMPTMIPSNLSPDQEKIYLRKLCVCLSSLTMFFFFIQFNFKSKK